VIEKMEKMEKKPKSELLSMDYDSFYEYHDKVIAYIDSLHPITDCDLKMIFNQYKKEILIPASFEMNDAMDANADSIDSANTNTNTNTNTNQIDCDESPNEFESPKLDDLINRYFITLIPKCEKGEISITDHRILIHVLKKLTKRLEAIPVASKIAAKEARKKKFSSTKWNSI
jgi:hypothetical protein